MGINHPVACDSFVIGSKHFLATTSFVALDGESYNATSVIYTLTPLLIPTSSSTTGIFRARAAHAVPYHISVAACNPLGCSARVRATTMAPCPSSSFGYENTTTSLCWAGCPAGTLLRTSDAGNIFCFVCGAGTYSAIFPPNENSTCTPCPAGTHLADNGTAAAAHDSLADCAVA